MENGRPLSAQDILGVDDIETVDIVVPEWKGTVRLRVLPADEGLALNERMQALPKENQYDAIFMLLGACLIGPDGKRLFTSDADLLRLRTRSQKVLLKLQKKALELQGWSEGGAPSKNA